MSCAPKSAICSNKDSALPNLVVLNDLHKRPCAEPFGIKRCRLFLFFPIERLQVMLLIAQSHFNDFARHDTKAINNLTIKLNRRVDNPSMQC